MRETLDVRMASTYSNEMCNRHIQNRIFVYIDSKLDKPRFPNISLLNKFCFKNGFLTYEGSKIKTPQKEYGAEWGFHSRFKKIKE